MENQQANLICFLCQGSKEKHFIEDQMRAESIQDEDAGFEMEESPVNMRADIVTKAMLTGYKKLEEELKAADIREETLCSICFTNTI